MKKEQHEYLDEGPFPSAPPLEELSINEKELSQRESLANARSNAAASSVSPRDPRAEEENTRPSQTARSSFVGRIASSFMGGRRRNTADNQDVVVATPLGANTNTKSHL